jgi:hypothetical protein
VKDKASQLVGALFYSCFGLFILVFGIYFFSAGRADEVPADQMKHRLGIIEEVVTKVDLRAGLGLNFYFRIKDCDTLFYFKRWAAKDELVQNTGNALHIDYSYVDTLGCYQAHKVTTGSHVIFPIQENEQVKDEHPLRGFSIFMIIIGAFITLLAVYTLYKIYRYFRVSSQFTHRVKHEFIPVEKMTAHELVLVQNEMNDIKTSFFRYVALGVGMVCIAVIVPFKYTSFHNYADHHNDLAGNETVLDKMGVWPFVALAVLVSLIFIFILRTDIRKLKKDQEEQKKTKIKGKIILIEKKEKEPEYDMITIEAEGITFEQLERRRIEHVFRKNNLVEMEVTVNAQFVLSLKKQEPSANEQPLLHSY